MTAPVVYVTLRGSARHALEFYASVFDGQIDAHTFTDFGRTDGAPDAIAHGALHGPVTLFICDAGTDEPTARLEGVRLALLGCAPPGTLHRWFDQLATGGTILDPLARKSWGASDGEVIDQFGLRWLIGYEPQP